MSMEELRSFSQVLTDISVELSDGATVSNEGGADNVVYFTREHFDVGLRFPVPSLVKKFLHFTRAPPALIHPNVFGILKGCSLLNSLPVGYFSLRDFFYLHFEA